MQWQRKEHTGMLNDALFVALVHNKMDFVRLFIDNGVELKRFLTIRRLRNLYSEVTLFSTFKFKKCWKVFKKSVKIRCLLVMISLLHACLVNLFQLVLENKFNSSSTDLIHGLIEHVKVSQFCFNHLNLNSFCCRISVCYCKCRLLSRSAGVALETLAHTNE